MTVFVHKRMIDNVLTYVNHKPTDDCLALSAVLEIYIYIYIYILLKEVIKLIL